MKIINMEKYLDNSNKRLASQPASQPASQYKPKQKIWYKESVYEANYFIHGLFMFLYLIFINHKLKKKSD